MLYGQTEEAQQKKRVQASRQWDEASILGEIERRHGAEALSTARQIIEWMKTKGRIWYGSGSKDGSVGVTVSGTNGSQSYPIAIYSYYGQVEIRFQYMKRPFDDPMQQEELREKLNAIQGVNLRSDKVRPYIPIVTFSNDKALAYSPGGTPQEGALRGRALILQVLTFSPIGDPALPGYCFLN
jgi:hypothetical protein